MFKSRQSLNNQEFHKIPEGMMNYIKSSGSRNSKAQASKTGGESEEQREDAELAPVSQTKMVRIDTQEGKKKSVEAGVQSGDVSTSRLVSQKTLQKSNANLLSQGTLKKTGSDSRDYSERKEKRQPIEGPYVNTKRKVFSKKGNVKGVEKPASPEQRRASLKRKPLAPVHNRDLIPILAVKQK